jgi:type II secretory pathway pseudopilin PulG
MNPSQGLRHRAFTVVETVVALGILSMVTLLVAQLATWTLTERTRTAARNDAAEAAANVLEAARAMSWEALTPDWASAQKLPESLASRLRTGRLSVRVEQEASRPKTKKVIVAVYWEADPGTAATAIELTGLFSARNATAPGRKP